MMESWEGQRRKEEGKVKEGKRKGKKKKKGRKKVKKKRKAKERCLLSKAYFISLTKYQVIYS